MPSSVAVDGDLIKRLREEKGLERSELAELAGVTPHRMYVIEGLQKRTRLKTLRKISLALGVEPPKLVDKTR